MRDRIRIGGAVFGAALLWGAAACKEDELKSPEPIPRGCCKSASECYCTDEMLACLNSEDEVERCLVSDLVGAENGQCCQNHYGGRCECSASECFTGSADVVPECSSAPIGSSTGPGGASCSHKDSGSDFAPCDSDSDCYSAFCDTSESPAYCHIPTHAARADLHGYDCSSDADCAEAAPEWVESGGMAVCRNDDIYSGCSFWCDSGG
jgi:hypothetical protein